MLSKLAVTLLASGAIAASAETQLQCPDIHVFGARHTGAPEGYGLAEKVVNSILKSHPGATAEPIHYPADGAGSSEVFSRSARTGVHAVTHQVTSFVNECPDTRVVLVGYSQVY